VELWSTPVGRTYSFRGTRYSLVDSPALAARFATEFNMPFASVAATAEQFARVRAACEAAGRDPATLTLSAALVACVGEDRSAVARGAAAIGRDPAELRENGVAGTPAEAVETLRRFAEAGAERVYLQVLDLTDLDHLRLVAAEVAPHVR
jgi:alkanesulfonate monooxygenase SsuD/methylene tetrahydromethanopterin reductase-like flavin-dependent oxidoreductase (luciferase family)